MSEKLLYTVDLNETQKVTPESTPDLKTASVILDLAGIAIRFSRVERTPRYDEETRESDVEHSYMLGIVASELAEMLYPDLLNSSLVNDFAQVHDLIELKVGDVATFHIDEAGLARKKAAEHAALEELLQELPPRLRRLLIAYESQESPESRFVCAVDKNLPVAVDIIGAGQKMLNEDYNVHTDEELYDAHEILRARMQQRFSEFPEIVHAHGLLCELLELEFVATQ